MRREVGGGHAPRQPGQVRKEAAATSARPGSLFGLPPYLGPDPADDMAARHRRPDPRDPAARPSLNPAAR